MKTSQEITRLHKTLLADYDNQGRTLPWRIRPEDKARGIVPDPYAIWLSEIMCQQTTTTAARPFWEKFLKQWPKVEALACAPRADILSAWAGLGYYARARNLHKCANIICEEYDGVFPKTQNELLKLPGIGAYTAAAMAAICFGQLANVVDGNVERVISRLFAVKEKMPKAKTAVRWLAGTLASPKRPDDYAQGLMDLGAHICKPKNPKCDVCPWLFACAAYKEKAQESYPRKAAKKTKARAYGAVFYIENADGFWARTRKDEGLLGGMTELPGTKWTTDKPPQNLWMKQAPLPKNWQSAGAPIKHVFTHFTLYLSVYTASHKGGFPDITVGFKAAKAQAFPSLMMKAIKRAQARDALEPLRADAANLSGQEL
ncbi:MAG: A/G-specific adenine glycosylase [Robiginitomaculum sp.]